MENTEQTQEPLTLDQFRQAKQSGIDLYAETQQEQEDAAPVNQEVQEKQQEEDAEDPSSETVETQEEEDGINLPDDQKTAFQKALEREKRKALEKAREQLETEYSSYKRFFETVGTTPEDALRLIEQNNLLQQTKREVSAEADRLAYQYGWTDEQTQSYIEEQSQIRMRQIQQEQELHDLRVQVQINNLADSADYPGIKGMKDQISRFIRENPKTTVEQAYWAVGGKTLAQQLRREAEQREAAKRAQVKRTVMSDTPESMKSQAPLPPEAIQFAKENGLTEEQVRMWLDDKGPKTLEDYRKMKRRA